MVMKWHVHVLYINDPLWGESTNGGWALTGTSNEGLDICFDGTLNKLSDKYSICR